MRRLLAAALLVAAPAASAAARAAITPSSIAGAKLGLSAPAYKRILGAPAVKGELEGGFSRLTFPRRKTEVYFRRIGTAGPGYVVATWNRSYRTAEGVGPCSTVARLKAAYGARLKPFTVEGRVVAYALGSLIFTVEGARRVKVVALGKGRRATFIALNVTECR